MDLDWSLSLEGDGHTLLVSYRLRNTGDAPVLVLDQMIDFASSLGLAPQGYASAPDAIIVRADAADPTLVHLSRGRVEPVGEARMEVIPGLRTLAAGSELSGQARLALPLRAWHPNDRASELVVVPTRAVLEIGVLPQGSDVRSVPLLQGNVECPSRAAAIVQQRWVRGEVRAIP